MQAHPEHLALATVGAEPTVRVWTPTLAEPQPMPELEAARRASQDHVRRRGMISQLLHGLGALADLLGGAAGMPGQPPGLMGGAGGCGPCGAVPGWPPLAPRWGWGLGTGADWSLSNGRVLPAGSGIRREGAWCNTRAPLAPVAGGAAAGVGGGGVPAFFMGMMAQAAGPEAPGGGTGAAAQAAPGGGGNGGAATGLQFEFEQDGDSD